MAGGNENNASISFLIKHLEWVNEYFPAKKVLRKPMSITEFAGRFLSGIRRVCWHLGYCNISVGHLGPCGPNHSEWSD